MGRQVIIQRLYILTATLWIKNNKGHFIFHLRGSPEYERLRRDGPGWEISDRKPFVKTACQAAAEQQNEAEISPSQTKRRQILVKSSTRSFIITLNSPRELLQEYHHH